MQQEFAKQLKILVIDDPTLAQGYLKFALQELGFEHISYTDQTDAAIQRIHDTHYDLILCAYHLRKDQQGLELYRHCLEQDLISQRTAFVFISADTSADIVHSIIEIKPDDFLVKPFTVRTLDRRLTKILNQKRALRDILSAIDQQDFTLALERTDALLTNPARSEHYPAALRLKGELLIRSNQHQKAHDFYQAIINVQSFAWAQLGLIESLRLIGHEDEAEKRLLRLALKPDAQLVAFDLLSDLKIDQRDFDMALESTLMAAEISPRNIQRHQKALNLSRLTHDYQKQFEITKNIVRFSRHTVNEQAHYYLNVARAGVDYAMASDDENTTLLLAQSNDYLKRYRQQFPRQQALEEISVLQARILYLQNEKSKAKALIDQVNDETLEADNIDALLDKAKAFHELGLYEKSLRVLDEIESRAKNEPEQARLFVRYVQQERAERDAIRMTPKELNNEAVSRYQRGDMELALTHFRQAFKIMPKNPSIALNLMQTLVFKAQQQPLSDTLRQIMEECQVTLENHQLNDEQTQRYQRIQGYLQELF